MTLIYDQDMIRGFPGQELRIPHLSLQGIEVWGKIYIQGMAALEPAPRKFIAMHVGILLAMFPNTTGGDGGAEAALLPIVDDLKNYGCQAILTGLEHLRTRRKNDFRPSTAEPIIAYVHPIQSKLAREMKLLEKVLNRNAEYLAQPAPQKQIEQEKENG